MLETIKRELKMIYSTKVQSQEGKRETWLDMARGIAIILVVMGHRGFITKTTNTWLSSFHLPLFFMVSGIIIQMKNERETEGTLFLLKKIKSLLVPYFLFSFCSMALDFHFVPAGPENLIPDFKLHLLQTFTLQGYSVMWFLPVTFIAELIIYFMYRKVKIAPLTAVMIVLSFGGYYMYKFLSPQMTDILTAISRIVFKSFIAAAFMCYGMIFYELACKGNKDAKNNVFNWKQLLLGVMLFGINIVSTKFIELKDLNNLDLGYLSVYLLLGITGSCGLFLVCKNCINISPLTYFGRNSLIIFCTHLNCYVLYYGTIFYMHFYKHYHLPDIVNENITANIYTLFFTFLLSIPVIFVINVFFPFMTGQRYGFNKKSA